MEMNEISRLATYLRQNGEAILNSSTKLMLTTQLLRKLNEAFPLIVENGDYNGPSAFRVINTNNSKFEIYHDLAFLHDFIQKTVSLKITNLPSISINLQDVTDIKKFGILKCLELNKVPVVSISGIQCVQSHVDTLVCIRCLRKLEDVLKYCGADHSSGFVWSELRKAVFSYNALEKLDQSLNYAPWLQTLDLSHNRLSNADSINCLPNLKCLNLSYNLLQRVPTFNKAAAHKLLILVMKFNYVEDLSELSGLTNLKELDLSCNCLMDHQASLRPLLQLASLCWLSLEGNPLSYHRKHRLLTSQCLHNNTTNDRFLLNGLSLSKAERLAVGTLSPALNAQQYLTLSNSTDANSSTSSDIPGDPVAVRSLTKSHASKRSGKVREALISEQSEGVHPPEIILSSSIPASSLEMSFEHLETKKQIETLRERFGEENWLHSRGGSCVQNILGLPQPPKPAVLSLTSSPVPYVDAGSLMHQQILLGLRSREDASVIPKIVTPVKVEPTVVVEDVKELSTDMVASTDSIFGSKEMSPGPENNDSMDEEDSEMDEQVYPVQRESIVNDTRVELFLVVTKFLIKEKEISFGKTQQKWTVDSLLSCSRICNEPAVVQLAFDTVRRDRQERRYIMEEEDAQSLVKTLVGVLESRSLSAMHQTVFRCLNCSSQFSREIIDSWSTTNNSECPNCGSTLVIQVDDVPSPVADRRNEKTNRVAIVTKSDTTGLEHSSSQSSIGSAASLDQSPEWASGVGDVGSTPRCDSDIEVISNPSQSSIEVLDDRGTPIRKRSEERQAESAIAGRIVQDNKTHFLALAGLTESSSSGSFTDSICTTYENRFYTTGQPRGSFNHSTDEREDSTISEENECLDVMSKSSEVIDSGNGRSVKDSESSTETLEDTLLPKIPTTQNPGIILTSVLDGLLQSVSSKLSRTPTTLSSSPRSEGVPDIANKVRYSYVNFDQVDHRVKLHLYLQVFKQEHEQLTLLVRASVLQQTNSLCYPSCVVFSTHMVYILKIIGPEGDDPEKWLKKQDAFPLSCLDTIYGLPWNQGACLTFKQLTDAAIPSSFLILLQDKERTLNLLFFLKGISLPKGCFHKCLSVPAIDEVIQSMDSIDDNKSTCSHLAIFSHCKILNDSSITQEGSMGVFIISKTNLVLSMDNLLWLFPESSRKLQILRTQKMSNLLEVEVANSSISLHFLDETIEKDETWTVSLETVDSLQDILAAIKLPWEELFLVPLQIMYKSRK